MSGRAGPVRDGAAPSGVEPSTKVGAAGGQATLELVLVLPFVVTLALLVVQVGLLAHRQVLVAHAAREAARAAAVTREPGEVASAARAGAERAGGLDPSRIGVEARLEAGRVEVDVAVRDSTDVALVGPLLPDVTLRATATMRWESASNR